MKKYFSKYEKRKRLYELSNLDPDITEVMRIINQGLFAVNKYKLILKDFKCYY
jgi:hypothetical protein